MVLILFILFCIITTYYYKNIYKGLFLSFLTFLPISYIILVTLNFLGISNLLISGITAFIISLIILKYTDFELENNKYFKYVFLLIGIIGVLNIIFPPNYMSYDGKNYHIDSIYGLFLNQNVFHDYITYWSIYPKFGDFILGTFYFPLSKINFFLHFIGNIVLLFIIAILVNHISYRLGIKKDINRFFVILFVVFAPVVIFEASSALVDNIFFLYILYSFYFIFEKFSFKNLFLLSLSIIALINIKYSGPFLGFILFVTYLILNYKEFKGKNFLKLALVSLIFIPGFTYYIHSFLVYNTPLYPFHNLQELHQFFQNLSHAPKGINGNTLYEIVYANIVVPNALFLYALYKEGLRSITWGIPLYYFGFVNVYGVFWILAFFSVFYLIYLLLRKKIQNKNLAIFLIIVLTMYFIQSLKWEVRYFLHFLLLGWISLFYILEIKNINFKKYIIAGFSIQFLIIVYSIIYYRITANLFIPQGNYNQYVLYKNSPFVYPYYYIYSKTGKKIPIVNQCIKGKKIIHLPLYKGKEPKNCQNFKYNKQGYWEEINK